MKKIKLLASIAGLSTLVGACTGLVTSCSNNSNGHISSVDRQKHTNENGMAVYNITLDRNDYDKKDIKVEIFCDYKDKLNLSWVVNGNVLSITVTYTEQINQQKTINFSFKVSTNTWSEIISGFKLVLEVNTPFTQCIITFDTDGGSDIEAIAVNFGTAPLSKKPADPTKTDCEFAGWFNGAGEAFDWTKPVYSDMTIHAHWNDIGDTATVVFNLNYDGGGTYTTSQVTKGETVSKPATDPTRVHYDFVEWCTDPECENPYDFDNEVSGSMSLYAKWNTNTFDVGYQYDEKAGGYLVCNKLSAWGSERSSAEYEGTLEIPEKYDDGTHGEYPVVGFGSGNPEYPGDTNSYGFANTKIKSIKLPATIKSISQNAFYCCSELQSLNSENEGEFIIPEGIEEIGDQAFFSCAKMTSVTFPSTIKNIGVNAFYDCGLSYTLSADGTLQYVPNGKPSSNAYNAHYLLNSYPEGQAFWKNTITVDPECKIIGPNAFKWTYGEYYQQNDVHIVLPENLEIICSHAFDSLTILDITYGTTSAVSEKALLPSSIKYLGSGAFYNCSGVKKFDLSKCTQLTAIEDQTFWCDSQYRTVGYKYDEIDLPSSITKIGNGAFDGTDITSFTINKNVASIASDAFANCVLLTSLSVDSQNTKYKSSTDGKQLYSKIDDSSYQLEMNIDKSSTSITLLSGTKVIGDSAFADNEVLESITIPSSVEEIKDNAFKNCNKIKSFTIDSSSNLQTIGDYAFTYAFDSENPVDIVLPESVTSIGAGCFQGSNIKSIDVGGVTEIPSGSFQWCGNLQSVALNNVEKIGDDAFNSCSSLGSITLPETIDTIGADAFMSTGITTISFPITTRVIGVSAFYGTQLTADSIQFADGSTNWTITHWYWYDIDSIIEEFDPTDTDNKTNVHKYLTQRYDETDQDYPYDRYSWEKAE